MHMHDSVKRQLGFSTMSCLRTLPCTVKTRGSLLAPAHPGGPGKRAVKQLWCGGGVSFLKIQFAWSRQLSQYIHCVSKSVTIQQFH